MSQPIDHSDRLARVQVLLQILTDREPSGDWQQHSLVKKWQKSSYAVTYKQFLELERFLEGERQRVTAPKFEQISLFGERK